jgi:hypothetical protein
MGRTALEVADIFLAHGSPTKLNATITGLKFFFEVTVSHRELMAKMQPVHLPPTLPLILSREEAGRLIAAAGEPVRHYDYGV